MATDPTFFTVPHEEISQISTANTGLDGSGTIGTIFTAHASGSLLRRIWFKAQATSAAGMIRVYRSANGSTWRLFTEINVPAITVSSTQAAFEFCLEIPDDNTCKASYYWGAAPHNSETFNVVSEGLDPA
jgi:hypothetical protein